MSSSLGACGKGGNGGVSELGRGLSRAGGPSLCCWGRRSWWGAERGRQQWSVLSHPVTAAAAATELRPVLRRGRSSDRRLSRRGARRRATPAPITHSPIEARVHVIDAPFSLQPLLCRKRSIVPIRVCRVCVGSSPPRLLCCSPRSCSIQFYAHQRHSSRRWTAQARRRPRWT